MMTYDLFISFAARLSTCVFVGSGLIMLTGLAVNWLCRSRSAAERFSVWKTAFVLALSLPLAVFALPEYPLGYSLAGADRALETHDVALQGTSGNQIAISSNAADSRGIENNVVPDLAGKKEIQVPAGTKPAKSVESETSVIGKRMGFWPCLIGVWLFGACFFVTRIIFACRNVHELRNSSRFENINELPGVVVGYHKNVTVPITAGIFQPAILLPASAVDWPETRRDLVLQHEMSHVQRRDVFWQLLSSLAKSLAWIQPLMWLAQDKMVLERERACDDHVVNNGVNSQSYAEMLLKVADESRRNHFRLVGGCVAMAAGSLEKRIKTVLDPLTSRRAPSRIVLVASVLGLSAMMLGAATIRPFSPVAVAAQPGIAHAQEPLAETDGNDQATTREIKLQGPIRVKALSVDGEPIAGAEMTLEFTRFVSSNSIFVKSEFTKIGKWEQVTDEQGNADFDLGEMSLSHPEQIYVSIQCHADWFVTGGKDMLMERLITGSLRSERNEITLSKGVAITGRLVAAKNQAVQHPSFYVVGKLKENSDGWRNSWRLSKTNCTTDGSFELFVPEDADLVMLASDKNSAVSRVPFKGKPQDLGDVKLKRGGRISGRVVDNEGHSVANVLVLLREKGTVVADGVNTNSSVQSAVLTDKEGRYALYPHFGECTVTLGTYGNGRNDLADNLYGRSEIPNVAPKGFKLSAGDEINHDFVPGEMVKISGVVRKADGTPAVGVEVATGLTVQGVFFWHNYANTDSNGKYSLAVPHGSTVYLDSMVPLNLVDSVSAEPGKSALAGLEIEESARPDLQIRNLTRDIENLNWDFRVDRKKGWIERISNQTIGRYIKNIVGHRLWD